MINDIDQIVLKEIHWTASVSFRIDSYHFLYTYIFFFLEKLSKKFCTKEKNWRQRLIHNYRRRFVEKNALHNRTMWYSIYVLTH